MQQLLAAGIVLLAIADSAIADVVSDYITPCQDDSTDFTVKVQFDNGKKNDWVDVMCTRSYSRCPPLFIDGSCVDDDVGDWAAESGKTFDYLETKVRCIILLYLVHECISCAHHVYRPLIISIHNLLSLGISYPRWFISCKLICER